MDKEFEAMKTILSELLKINLGDIAKDAGKVHVSGRLQKVNVRDKQGRRTNKTMPIDKELLKRLAND